MTKQRWKLVDATLKTKKDAFGTVQLLGFHLTLHQIVTESNPEV